MRAKAATDLQSERMDVHCGVPTVSRAMVALEQEIKLETGRTRVGQVAGIDSERLRVLHRHAQQESAESR
jgi:hypothetical protein